jgi:hypothetical protein
LKKWFFSSNIIKTPQVLQRQSIEKKREKEEEKVLKKRKLQESLQIKGKVNILREEKHFNFKNSFLYDSIFTPPSYHFKNLFQIIEKIFLTLFGPTFRLAIYMSWVLPFSFTNELHIFSF